MLKIFSVFAFCFENNKNYFLKILLLSLAIAFLEYVSISLLYSILSIETVNFLLLFSIVFAQLLSIWIMYILSKLTFAFAYSITGKVYYNSVHQELCDIEDSKSAYYENILINETSRFSLNVFQGSIDIFVRSLIVIAMCIPFFYMSDAKLITILTIIFVVFVIIVYVLKRRFTVIGNLITNLNEETVRFITTTFDRIVYLKGTNRIVRLSNQFRALMKNFAGVQARNQFLLKSPKYILELFVFLAGIGFITWTGGEISSTSIPSFFALIKIVPSLQTIYQLYGKVSTHYSSLSTVKKLCFNEDIQEQHNFQSISFEYNFEWIEFNGIVNIHSDKSREHNFKFIKGKINGIEGESGVGKSTLFKLILGLYKESYESVKVNGELLTSGHVQYLRDRTSFLTQTVFFTDDDVRRLNDLPHYLKLEYSELFKLDLFRNISPNASNMSGGQRQRLALLLALIEKPQFLFIDETFSGFSVELALEILKLLKLRLPETFIWFISHDKRIIDSADLKCRVY